MEWNNLDDQTIKIVCPPRLRILSYISHPIFKSHHTAGGRDMIEEVNGKEMGIYVILFKIKILKNKYINK